MTFSRNQAKFSGMKPLPAIELLRRLFECDPAEGTLTRKPRPPEDFSALRLWRMWNARYAGRAAGGRRTDGYIMVRVIIDGVKYDILKHRLIWVLTHGCWPEKGLDHRDGDMENNRIDNLREANQEQNLQNIAVRSSTQGTNFDPRSKRWQALLGLNGKKVHLGMFPTVEAAHEAYLRAKAELHQFQPVPRR
jgi:hypothetical protein